MQQRDVIYGSKADIIFVNKCGHKIDDPSEN